MDNIDESRFQLVRFRDKYSGTFVFSKSQIPLSGKKMLIGKTERCSIMLMDEKVEDRHAVFLIEEDRVFIVDLDSVTGTYVNGRRIAGRTLLKHMDQIIAGNTRFLFLDTTYPVDSSLLEDFFDESLPDVQADFEYKLRSDQSSINLNAPQDIAAGDSSLWNTDFIGIIQEIVSGDSLPNLLEKLLTFLFNQFPADRGFILLLDPVTQQLAPVATRSRLSGAKKSRLAISKTLLKRAWREKESILVCDLGDIQKTESILFHGFTSVLVAPLIYNDKFLGVLQLDTIEHHKQLSDTDLKKMQVYSNIAALAIANARLREQLWEEEHTKNALSRYLPRKLIEQVLTGETLIPPEGTQCNVAVFFADIRGFSKMSGRLPPRDIVEILNEYYNEVSDIIFEHSGMINQFVGDEIMAIFGGPWITDPNFNPADSAIQASKEVIRQICRMNVDRHEDGKETIFVGVGVDYGQVIIGNLGSSKKFEFTAIGNTVVLANRLCSKAKESQILVSDRAMKTAIKSYVSEMMEPITAKNVKDPIIAHKVFWNR